jgi:hypothetical protein
MGAMSLNRCDVADPRPPWSGVGQSGRGHSLSELSFDALTPTRSFRFRKRERVLPVVRSVQ